MKYEDKFNFKVYTLIEFLNLNERYPRPKEIYKGVRLKSFINLLRNMYMYGVKLSDGSIEYKDDVLTKAQIDKLNSANFIWEAELEEKPIKKTTKEKIIIANEINKEKIKKNNEWNKNFELLCKFLDENETIPPSEDIYYNGVFLGKWYDSLKKVFINGKLMPNGSIKYKNEVLTQEQVEKVKQISKTFNYTQNKRSYKWNFYYDLLCEYIQKFDVFPKGYDYYKGYFLASWCNEQRTIFNNGTKKEDGTLSYQGLKLTPSEINKLNNINFDWVMDMRRYLSKKINKKEDLEKRKRYLQVMLDRFIEDKEDIPSKQEFNEYYMKILSKRD